MYIKAREDTWIAMQRYDLNNFQLLENFLKIFVASATTIYADIARTMIESIRVNGELCKNTLDFMFDKIAQAT